jgi:hypothetical protein
VQRATDTEPQNFAKEAFWRWVNQQPNGGWNIFSGGDNHLARRWASSSEIRWTTQGMPSFTALTSKRKNSIRLAIAVKQQGRLIHMGNELEEKRFGGRFTLGMPERAHALYAEAAAQTEFAPPPASGTASAAPNLFQPFWRARLIDIADTKQRGAPK